MALIKTFTASTGDKGSFVDALDGRVNAWLKEHPNITIVDMYQSAFASERMTAVILTVYYIDTPPK